MLNDLKLIVIRKKMTILANISSGLLLLIVVAVSYYYLNKVRTTDWRPYIRALPAVLAMEECVGRSMEMGRPLLYSPGASGSLTSASSGPSILAGISILGYVASMCAKSGTKLICNVHNNAIIPLVEDVIETSYRMEGVFDQWNPENVRFLGGTQQSFTSGHLGTIAREKPATQIICGYLAIAQITVAEAGKTAGLLQIGGNTNTYQLPYLVAGFDYWLLGDELLAAGADLSKDPLQLATIFGEDIIKYLVIGLILLGLVLSAFGFDFFPKWLKM